MSRQLLVAVAAAAAAAAATPSAGFDCSFSSSYPRSYVAYRNFDRDLVIDGKLDDAAWQEVAFTEDFVDISTSTTPRLRTNVKMRFDDEFLYVGARLEETMLAANITYCCHCNDEPGDQVIFHDNDFEIFVDADGSTHNYKEYEMNAANMNGTSATWDLLLDKTYTDGGGENSSRVFGANGWDDMMPRDRGHARTFSDGVLNDPTQRPTFWSAEVALPLAKLAELTSAAGQRVGSGKTWRINFSRVEWAIKVVNGVYQKYPSCQSCPDPGGDHEDKCVGPRLLSEARALRARSDRAPPLPLLAAGCGLRRAPSPCTSPRRGVGSCSATTASMRRCPPRTRSGPCARRLWLRTTRSWPSARRTTAATRRAWRSCCRTRARRRRSTGPASTRRRSCWRPTRALTTAAFWIQVQA